MSLSHKHAILDALMLVLDEDTAIAVIEYRKELGRKHVLTERSAKMMAKQLLKFADPQAAAEEMILRGWQTIKPEWVQRNQSQPTGRRNYADVAMDRMREYGTAGVFGGVGNAELLSSGSGQPGPHDEHLRGGIAQRLVTSRH